MSGRLLIVDDDQAMCEMLEASLTRRGFAVEWRTCAEEAVETLKSGEFDVLLTDLQMPNVDGLELCRRVVALRPDVPVVVITAFGSMDSVVSALRAGAYDFVNKPIDTDTLILLLERAVRHRQLLERIRVLSKGAEESQGFGGLIGTSTPMQKVYDLLKRITQVDTSVLIIGESGTGKELVARSLHDEGLRKDGPFVAFNCTAVPESLLESELFGHAKGAFTDAKADRAGLFEQANGGTLLLDEIADMPAELQPKLLRALEQRSVRPLGSNREVSFDVRIVSATNRDIESLVEEGKFREDLFYRLNVIQVNLPPLRARGNDILLLAQRFVTQFASASGKDVVGISTPAAEKLLAYPWPGNVRELRNSIERAVALTQLDKLVIDDLPVKVRGYSGKQPVVVSDDPEHLLTMDEVEERYIKHILNAVGDNKTMAARILGMDRKTLYRKLEKYKL